MLSVTSDSGSGNGDEQNDFSFFGSSSSISLTNIFDACKAGDLDNVQQLARNGVDVCRANGKGWPLMLLACF